MQIGDPSTAVRYTCRFGSGMVFRVRTREEMHAVELRLDDW